MPPTECNSKATRSSSAASVIGVRRGGCDRPQLVGHGAGLLRFHVAGVERRLALDEKDMALLLGDRIVAHPFRHDEHLPFTEFDRSALHLDAQPALENQEQFVLVLVAVPGEGAVDPRNLDVRVIDFADDPGRPEFRQRGGDLFGRHDL